MEGYRRRIKVAKKKTGVSASLNEDAIINKYSTSSNSDDYELSDEDLKNRREVLAFFHFDPFENETIHDQKQLYRDLVSMCDPAMAEDLPKQRGAISLVRSYLRVDRLMEAIQSLSSDPDKMVSNAKELKTLTEMLTREQAIVASNVKDYGFAEKYATAKSRGAGTLTAVVRDIELFDYDDGKVNRYDIATSESMQQAADISSAAIMKQISLSEADYAEMLKEQREKLSELYKECARLKEENRLIYKQITKQELLKELAIELEAKGLGRREVQAMVMAEIMKDDENFKSIVSSYINHD